MSDTHVTEKFAEFVAKDGHALAVYAVRQGATWDESADVTQYVFMSLWEKWGLVDNPSAWARTVAKRRAFELVKHRKRLTTAAEPAELSREEPGETDPDPGILSEEQDLVLRLLGELPARQREVLAFHYDGHGIEEIAELLHLSPATTRSHLRHARKRLRKLLEESAPAVS